MALVTLDPARRAVRDSGTPRGRGAEAWEVANMNLTSPNRRVAS